MKHPSTRQLFEYWDAQRGLRTAPEHSEIDPGAIRRVLADTFILSFDSRAGHPFRIAGTRVCAAFGRELRSEGFIDLWRREDRLFVGDLVTVVAIETIGVVANAHAYVGNGVLDFETLLLPLRHRGRPDARLLGALAPIETPYWFGASALPSLALGPHRFLPLGCSAHLMSGVAPRLPRARHARGFLVYDGGQS